MLFKGHGMRMGRYIFVLVCICLCTSGCVPPPASSSARTSGAASSLPPDPPPASSSADPNNTPQASQVLDSYEATVPKNLNLEQIRFILGLQEGSTPSKSDPPDNWVTAGQTGDDEPEYRKSAILQKLIYHEISVTCWVVEANGNLTLLASQWAGKGKRIIVQQDYVNYGLFEKNGVPLRLGILLRVEADLLTLKGQVNLNGLFAAAVAVQTGRASGKLKVLVYGLSGEPVNALLPMPSNLSEESFMGALTAIGAIKAKIYDEQVFVEPCLLPQHETNRSRSISE